MFTFKASMGCLKLTYNETNTALTEVSTLKVVYVNPELRQKNKVDFLEVGGILEQSGGSFSDGFMNGGDRFGGVNGSNLTGVANMMGDLLYATYKSEAANLAKNWTSKAEALTGAKYVSYAGKSLGVLGAGFTAIESFADGNFSYGDAAKVGIGILTTFTPIGWAYGIADFAVGVATGSSITDRIGAGIDSYSGGAVFF